MNQYQQHLAQYQYFKNSALPNAKEIISAAKLGYSAGDISYVEYLFALQTSTDIHLNYLKSIQQINESVITIYGLINQ
ncbi:cobalt-zinc-cadmium resistance protein CzcA [Sphingobacterium lactis]|uniref:Cobalt-zinc-cadmium resistance protein CzcA n=1 Tax=Sphingobacterium lactis TaxID=797291 RepID=A0A1H5XH61_9SPHI|nr:cobalt-zinc-cadmium resistance protein CzcA [Sphingobacterium lactis]